MDDTTLGKIFQEISDKFTGMEPCSLDALEDKVLAVMYKLGSYLMESKVEDWNMELRHETCPDCGTKPVAEAEAEAQAEGKTGSHLGV